MGKQVQRTFTDDFKKEAVRLGAMPPPMLLILDEPTNHLDLDGIAALEAALAAYDGAVLAISHDEAFCKHSTRTERSLCWEICSNHFAS